MYTWADKCFWRESLLFPLEGVGPGHVASGPSTSLHNPPSLPYSNNYGPAAAPRPPTPASELASRQQVRRPFISALHHLTLLPCFPPIPFHPLSPGASLHHLGSLPGLAAFLFPCRHAHIASQKEKGSCPLSPMSFCPISLPSQAQATQEEVPGSLRLQRLASFCPHQNHQQSQWLTTDTSATRTAWQH